MSEQKIQEIVEQLKLLADDETVPKNVRIKLLQTAETLSKKGDPSIKVDKALHELTETAEDSNMDPHTRTELWNILSALEIRF